MTTIPSDNEYDTDFASNLDGTWKSNWQLTKQHFEAECRLTEENIIGLELLMGKMTVRYEGTRAVFTMPEIRFTKEGKERVIEGWTSDETIKILAQTHSQIALLSKAFMPDMDEDSINMITFENADTYWVYLGHLPFVDLHAREYFSREVS